VDVVCRAFHQETLDDDDDGDGDGDDASTEGEDGVSPKEVQLFTSIKLCRATSCVHVIVRVNCCCLCTIHFKFLL
jgi:hypothetical protein